MIQEDPWTGERVEFKVSRDYAKKEWRKQIYSKPSYWGETDERKQRKEDKAWVKREQRRERQRYIVSPETSHRPSPFRPQWRTVH